MLAFSSLILIAMKLSTLFHWAVYFYFGEESIRLIEGLCKYFKRKTMLRNSKIFYKKYSTKSF